MSIQVIILAAGQGKRMQSSIPKVMHPLAGTPLIEHVLRTAMSLSDQQPILIYGHEGNQLQKALSHYKLNWIEQTQQLGTGHAVLQAMPAVHSDHRVLILNGDVPLISPMTLKRFIKATPKDQVGLLTAQLNHPFGYGRIIRDAHGQVTNIIEEKDATESERRIHEINTGI
jgi:bifunctional UDP-N-acetylglucosamine pyrophosphorylase/glucosamine-1-phosphate N-acetyltransferase